MIIHESTINSFCLLHLSNTLNNLIFHESTIVKLNLDFQGDF